MIVDAHVHLWRLARGDYAWLTPDLGPLYRDFEVEDLMRELEAAGVASAVVVQAAETEAETRFLLDLADQWPVVQGVVGWTDFTDPKAPAAVTRLAAEPKLKGLRPMLQDLEDDDFILRPAADAALAAMEDHGLRLDALVRPRHLSRLVEVRERHPTLAMVIDHAAKPDIAGGGYSTWARQISEVAADGVTRCKLSGLITEAGPDWTGETLAPYAAHILEAFGPERVLWGSDWPVLTLAGDYRRWLETTDRLLAHLAEEERSDVLGGNARRFYALN